MLQYYNVLVPIVLATTVVTTLNAMFVASIAEEKVDCHHASWLVMSVAGFVLAGRLHT